MFKKMLFHSASCGRLCLGMFYEFQAESLAQPSSRQRLEQKTRRTQQQAESLAQVFYRPMLGYYSTKCIKLKKSSMVFRITCAPPTKANEATKLLPY
jgi:hypothetical protein